MHISLVPPSALHFIVSFMDNMYLKVFRTILLVLLYMNPLGSASEFRRGAAEIRCIDKEREALLAVKQGIPGNSLLSSWGRSNATKDCCKWTGVSCSKQTGHVTGLRLEPPSTSSPPQGKISPKLFELQHLEILDLSYNNFSLNQIPKSIGSLRNLTTLHLFGCRLGGEIPYQLGNLTQLEFLDLVYNDFTNPKNLDWLSHLSSLTHLDLALTNLSNVSDWTKAVDQLPNLQYLSLGSCDLTMPVSSSISFLNTSKSLSWVFLSGNQLPFSILQWLSTYNTSVVSIDLSDNHLSGPIPDVFGNLSSLVHLALGDNSIEGKLPQTIGQLYSLQSLDLSSNHLSGPIPDVFGNLSSLVDLDLSWNSIEGKLPQTISQLCSLRSLDLSFNNLSQDFSEFIDALFGCASNSVSSLSLSSNQLNGTIPEIIGSFFNLSDFEVSMNSLTGVITEAHFSKLSKLEYLDLSHNSLTLTIRSDWLPPFKLGTVGLRSCKVGPNFPNWLRTSHKSLNYLDLSDAGISDVTPDWFQDTFMEVSPYQLGSDRYFNMSSNQLTGKLHSIPSELPSLDLSNNRLSGTISFLCTRINRNMIYLDLSSNSFSGELPNCWMHFENLLILNLSNNSFSGIVPTSIGSLPAIETLKLNKNNFVGELPLSLKNYTNLIVFDIGENRITGMIPGWIGDSLSMLAIIILRSNQFTGSIPVELCHLRDLQLLDLSRNYLSGTIPQCLNNLTTLAQKGYSNPSIKHYYLGTTTSVAEGYEDDAFLTWKGRMSEFKSTLGLVKSIDFSTNRLDGEIPQQITDLIGLVSLNLSRNHLSGQMPPQIGKLQSLDFLDLSRNHIYGSIPASLTQIYGLSFLDLSRNNLSGKIPTGTQLQSFDTSAYAENPQLCGPPLPKTCPTGESRSKQNLKEGEDELISYGFYVSMGLGFAVGFWGVFGSLIFNRSWRYTYFGLLDDLKDCIHVRTLLLGRKVCFVK